MDPRELDELSAAVAAHCEWLKSEQVHLRVPAPALLAVDLLHLSPTVLRNGVVKAVVTSLHALCALRTRANVGESRAQAREQAIRAVKLSTPKERAEAKRIAKQVKIINDDSHFEPLRPSIKELSVRLRTAGRKLEDFKGALRKRHAAFVKAGLAGVSGAPGDIALARWVMQRCDALEADLEFFVTEIEGPVAAASIGHPGSPDSKAWFRVQSNAKLWLREADAPSALSLKLFPSSRPRGADPEALRRKKDANRKAVKRAKKRMGSRR